jgi:hypothetical protein
MILKPDFMTDAFSARPYLLLTQEIYFEKEYPRKANSCQPAARYKLRARIVCDEEELWEAILIRKSFLDG